MRINVQVIGICCFFIFVVVVSDLLNNSQWLELCRPTPNTYNSLEFGHLDALRTKRQFIGNVSPCFFKAHLALPVIFISVYIGIHLEALQGKSSIANIHLSDGQTFGTLAAPSGAQSCIEAEVHQTAFVRYQ